MDGSELTFSTIPTTGDPEYYLTIVRRSRTGLCEETSDEHSCSDEVFELIFDQFHSPEMWHV